MPRCTKVVCRAARAGIENRNILIETVHVVPCTRIAAAGLLPRPAPGGEIIPARPARGFRVRRDDGNSGLDEIGPVVNIFGIALAHQKYDGRGVGCTVVGEPTLPVERQELPLGRYPVDIARSPSVTTSAARPSITERACLLEPPCD